jgi:hypothetical protein
MNRIKTGLILTAMILFSQFSCEDSTNNDEQSCNTDAPLEDLNWLKELKETLESNTMQSLILQYKYNGEDVFFVDPCYGCPDGMSTVYNCEGEILCSFGGFAGINTCPDFHSQATDSTVILDTRNFVCKVENPIEDLQWLKDIRLVFEQRMIMAGAQIIQYTFQEEYVFWIDDCYNCPDALIQIYNCEGAVICEIGGIDGRDTCPDFLAEATDSIMLFDNVQY